MRRCLVALLCLLAVLAAVGLPGCATPTNATSIAPQPAIEATPTPCSIVYMPSIRHTDTCSPIAGPSYQALSANPPPSDRPAEAHADLNLALRGYAQTNAVLGLVNYSGGSDVNAPQLAGLFADRRTPAFQSVYRVYNWDWGCNCRAAAIASPEVTLARLATTPGEIISLPSSGYQIGAGYMALVLYASQERLTLKYTREDNVVRGYTLHLEGLCVEPSLLALYQSLNAAGRASLPALRAGQSVGRARDDAIGVAIRDSGQFLDPRSRKDWWQGR